MIWYFQYSEEKSYFNITDEPDRTPGLNSRGYFLLPVEPYDHKTYEYWVDIEIYKNSHDYKILDPVTDYTILIDFVDYILPKYQREDKLKRILKNE